jgi:NADH-ubiquinone oxidoreductase chain 5
MYLSILLLPLLGSIFSGLFGRKLGSTGSQIVTIFCLVVSSILASIAFYEVAICSSPVNIYLTN